MTRAKGAYSHAEGQYTFTYADAAHSEGNNTHAHAPFSHAEGLGTKTNPDIIGQHVEGYYNADSDGVKVIGCGTADDARVNAVEVKQDGRVFVKGLGNFNGTNSNEAADLAHVVDSKANSNDVYNKTELDNILNDRDDLFVVRLNTKSASDTHHGSGDRSFENIVDAIANNKECIAIQQFLHYHSYCVFYLSAAVNDVFGTTETRRSIEFYRNNESGNIEILTYNPDKTYSIVEHNKKYNPMVETTYSDLIDLRNNSQLVPGQQYRITDYVTTTTQSDTQSAGHQFDIIVIADDVNILNENARAIQHDGDTYFSNSDLNAWEIKYCLDNNTNKFEWADVNNGKGVIYYMKDEWDNECPYDFKNIKFKPFGFDDNVMYYTFGQYDTTDSSLNGNCYNNIVKDYTNSGKTRINLIHFGDNCCFNTIGNDNFNNTFGNGCENNIFGDDCNRNSFGNRCLHNNFEYRCYFNSLGYNSCGNTFGHVCSYNTIGAYCWYNTFGDYCEHNTFDSSCEYNSLGGDCEYNKLGVRCSYNSFDNKCKYNSFRLSASSTDTLLNDCYYNHFNVGCSYNVIWNDVQPTSSNMLQNIKVVRGVSGTTTAYNFINIVDKNAQHEIKVAKNSKGEIKIYCEADLIA